MREWTCDSLRNLLFCVLWGWQNIVWFNIWHWFSNYHKKIMFLTHTFTFRVGIKKLVSNLLFMSSKIIFFSRFSNVTEALSDQWLVQMFFRLRSSNGQKRRKIFISFCNLLKNLSYESAWDKILFVDFFSGYLNVRCKIFLRYS